MLALACSAFFAVAGYPTFQVDCKRSPQRHIFPCSKMPLLGKIHANPNLKLVLQAQVPAPFIPEACLPARWSVSFRS